MLTSTLITDRTTWNNHLRPLPGAHFLQTWEWGALKQRTTGWQPERFKSKRELMNTRGERRGP